MVSFSQAIEDGRENTRILRTKRRREVGVEEKTQQLICISRLLMHALGKGVDFLSNGE